MLSALTASVSAAAAARATRCRPTVRAFRPSSIVAVAATSDDAAATAKAAVLYDIPVSNHGARVRLVMYWMQLEKAFTITNPSALGGIKSDAYLALNPQGKMPLLVLPNGLALPESEVISQYICHAYAAEGPSLIPDDPETRAVAALATRVHDLYLVPVQGAMYRGPMDIEARANGIAEIARQMDVIEGIMGLKTDGPFIAGARPTTADAALFPTWVFIAHILPKHFGWLDVFARRPHTAAWWEAMCADSCGARVLEEVTGGLEAWEVSGRFTKVGVDAHVKDRTHTWAH